MPKGIDTNIVCIRIDPAKRTVAQLRQKFGSNNDRVIRDIKRIVRAEKIDLRQLQVIEEKRLTQPGHDPVTRRATVIDKGGTPLLAAAGADTEDGSVGWRLLGCEDTHGIGILFGQGIGGGMVDVPVTLEWVRQRIRWVPAETDAQIAERANAYLHANGTAFTESGAGAALVSAIDKGPFQAGDSVFWIKDEVAVDDVAKLLAADLTDGPSEGRRLTRFGAAVREALLELEF